MAHDYLASFQPTLDTVAEKESKTETKRIAITMFGLTTPGVTAAMKHLESFTDPKTGKPIYDSVVFHATGAGGRSMERLISEKVRFVSLAQFPRSSGLRMRAQTDQSTISG